MSRRSGSRRQSGGRRLAKGATIGLLAALGGALPSLASEGEDRSAILILRAAEEGPAADLIAYDALIGGEEVVPASDFGFFQPVDDGYAFAGIRVRVGEALEVTECSGGLAPARVEGLFEGAYACGEELPVPLAYQRALGRMQPNLVDPNGVWVEEGFFVGSEMSVKLMPARGVSLAPGSVGRLTARDAPAEALNGLIGRVSPDGVQASGACGDGVAIFFPRIALAGCADAGLIEE